MKPKQPPPPPEPMEPAQAVTLAILCLEWESETAFQARNIQWGREVKAAAETLRKMGGVVTL